MVLYNSPVPASLPLELFGNIVSSQNFLTLSYAGDELSEAVHQLCKLLHICWVYFLIFSHCPFAISCCRIDLESAQFATHLRPFLHEKTDIFLHEFISFAKSPLDMIAYDARVSYGLQQQQQSSSAVANSSAGSQGESEAELSQGQTTLQGIGPVAQ